MRPRDGDESVGMITMSDDDEKIETTPLQLKEAGPDDQGQYISPRKEIFIEDLEPKRIKTPSLPATPIKNAENKFH